MHYTRVKREHQQQSNLYIKAGLVNIQVVYIAEYCKETSRNYRKRVQSLHITNYFLKKTRPTQKALRYVKRSLHLKGGS